MLGHKIKIAVVIIIILRTIGRIHGLEERDVVGRPRYGTMTMRETSGTSHHHVSFHTREGEWREAARFFYVARAVGKKESEMRRGRSFLPIVGTAHKLVGRVRARGPITRAIIRPW